jgi:glycosyltransferase involved in cell wall biosynthesis
MQDFNAASNQAGPTDKAGKADRGARFCVVIPAYNHGGTVRKMALGAQKTGLPVFVVDDGSTDDTFHQIEGLKGIHALRHESNRGKGAALCTGFEEALPIADWAVTLDADGQHDPDNIEEMVRAARAAAQPPGRALIVGRRMGMDSANVHWTSRFGRGFSNFWVSICGGPRIKDSQSGFRIYPLPDVLKWNIRARRFEFEVEALVMARRHQVPVVEVPVSVHYLPAGERVSHFRPWVDFFRNARTFSRLLTRRLFSALGG